MSKILGRFFFKLTSSGNLLGEYSNDKSQRCVTEAANRITSMEGEPEVRYQFSGDYESVWRETGDNSVCSNLNIRPKSGCIGIFKLKWRSPKGAFQFDGEGMLCDDTLIGNYWSD